MPAPQRIKIPVTLANVTSFLRVLFTRGLIVLGLFIWGITESSLFLLILAVFAFLRFIIYKWLELILPKSFIMKGDQLYFKIAFIIILLNPEKCRLEIIDISLSDKNWMEDYFLCLILNKGKVLFSLFKNRFKLLAESESIDIVEYMSSLSAELNIPYTEMIPEVEALSDGYSRDIIRPVKSKRKE